jgi:hypothetical protein
MPLHPTVRFDQQILPNPFEPLLLLLPSLQLHIQPLKLSHIIIPRDFQDAEELGRNHIQAF